MFLPPHVAPPPAAGVRTDSRRFHHYNPARQGKVFPAHSRRTRPCVGFPISPATVRNAQGLPLSPPAAEVIHPRAVCGDGGSGGGRKEPNFPATAIPLLRFLEGGRGELLGKKFPPLISYSYIPHAQLMVVGFFSRMMIFCKKFTALARPSSMVMRLSSCSMESTRS